MKNKKILFGIIAIIVLVLAAGVIWLVAKNKEDGKEEVKQQRNIDLAKNQTEETISCKEDSDCGTRFDTCNCRLVCRNIKRFDYFDDCKKGCQINETDVSTQACQCSNGKCEKKLVKYFETKEQ